MSQQADSTELVALKGKIALLEEQKKLLEAERLRLEEERKLGELQAGPSAATLETIRTREQAALLIEKKNLINAYAPTLPTGLQGSIAVGDNQSIEANAAAYRTMREVAGLVADALKDHLGGIILFLSTEDHNALTTANLFEADAALLRKAYENHEPTKEFIVQEILVGAGVLAKTASDIMALFRTDLEMKSRTVSIPDEALIAECASRLNSTRYYPNGFPSFALSPNAVVDALEPLEKARRDARLRQQMTLGQLDTQLAGAANDTDKKAASTRKQQLEARWTELEAGFNAFMQALRTRDAASGTTPLAQIMRGKWLGTQLANKGTTALTVKVLQSGGTYVLRKSFFKGTRLRQSGGVIVEYLLVDAEGKVLASGTIDRVREFANLTVPH